MTWKALDEVSLPIRLEEEDGTALVYADATAALADGWQWLWLLAAELVSPQPSFTLTPNPESIDGGDYFLTHSLVQGVHTLLQLHATHLPVPDTWVLVVGSDDADSIRASLAGALGTLVSSDRIAQYDWEWTEGDSFSRTMGFPSAALSDFGLSDLSDIAGQEFSIRCFARTDDNRPTSTKDFELPATIVSKTDRTVKVQIPAGLTGATISSGDSAEFEYDIQVSCLMPRAITAVSTVGKTFTVSGDQRLYFGKGKTFTVTASTGNNGTFTPTLVSYDGADTTITVSEVVPDATADGAANGLLRITGIRGVITCNEQETDA